MANAKCRLYCAVFGCLNSSITHRDFTFFKLPSSSERRLRWLKLICRDDLEKKTNFASYRVCEKHFNVEEVRQSQNRKLLKKNALPLLLLPNLADTVPEDPRKEDKQTQTTSTVSVGSENFTQTENVTNERHVQTTKSLFTNTPMETKLKAELLKCKQKIKLYESENRTRKAEMNNFHRLCDKFLTEKLALLIKAQSSLKKGKGNRYSKNYIIYCLKLHKISPQAYQYLQNALCLPSTTTLYKYLKLHKNNIQRAKEGNSASAELLVSVTNEEVNTCVISVPKEISNTDEEFST